MTGLCRFNAAWFIVLDGSFFLTSFFMVRATGTYMEEALPCMFLPTKNSFLLFSFGRPILFPLYFFMTLFGAVDRIVCIMLFCVQMRKQKIKVWLPSMIDSFFFFHFFSKPHFDLFGLRGSWS